ncbi:MAG: 4Fe-4S binding protein [Actinomycetota bacterium]|nr:4Fe-4S binding protein [Actinomycetota bacterium]
MSASPFLPEIRLSINDSCTACGNCLVTCHSHAMKKGPRKPQVIQRLCDLCYACIEICPRDAIDEVSG